VFLALVTLHAVHKHHIAIGGLSGFTVFSHITSSMARLKKRCWT
jgi:hypothetical protein